MLIPRTCCAVVALALLRPVFAYADPFIPNDPGYAKYTWYAPVVNLPAAWSYSQGSSSVIAAVLDTGVITSTPDLAGRALPAISAYEGRPPLDGTDIPHGTWVSSALAMQINNGVGGTGVGNFSILPITVTNSDGNNSSAGIASGIRLAADHGAKVINISQSTFDYSVLDTAAAYARSKGALTFVAMGNSNNRITLDGSPLPNLIFVSGTDQTDHRWNEGGSVGSSYGPYVRLSAPAVDILAADPTGPTGYALVTGTSMAAPLAAGAAALAWSINPDLTPDQVQGMLFNTATDLGPAGWDEEYGYGRIDIGAVAAAAAATVPEPGLLVMGIPALLLLRRRPLRQRLANLGQ